MILTLLLAALLPASSGAVDWSQVDVSIRKLDPALTQVTLSARQEQAIRPLLIHSLGETWPGCGSDTDAFAFYHTPLGPGVLKVQAGPGGCCGGQGSNGALWLIRQNGPGWQVLASPADGFGGWGLGLQPHHSHRLPDFVSGWQMGADDFTFSYFRFNGRRYTRISGAEVRRCSPDHEAFCLADGRRARNTGPRN